MADREQWSMKTGGLNQGSLKNIPQSKIAAFSLGAMNAKNVPSKKVKEEMKKKKEEEDAAEVYKEFVESFDDTSSSTKRMWVKGETVKDGRQMEAKPQEKKLYKPTSKLAELAASFQTRPAQEKPSEVPSAAKKSRPQDKKKSNLEIFKEELRQIQEERQERRKLKHGIGLVDDVGNNMPRQAPDDDIGIIGPKSLVEDYGRSFSYENEVQTTNLYLGNINPKMSEQQLCEIFGKYGPLASIKIMWPRSDDARQRGRNCGFVAFMNRKDGERALSGLQGKMVMEFEMKLGWGKAVPIPPHPVYIPPAMAELRLPPPPSGLPFNAQPKRVSRRSKYDGNASQHDDEEDFEKTIANAVVKVVIPTERNLLHLIHRMVEFVVREGPMFEAMIMNREINSPMFRFLFENQSPAHVYYRWKLFTILQGDSPMKWRTEEFRMFRGGSLWRPPPLNPYTQGMPEELVDSQSNGAEGHKGDVDDSSNRKGHLTESQRDRLEDMLRELTTEKMRIGDAMVWCLEHAEAAEEVVECIAESLSILQTPIPKKVARLFLISDILYNCCAKVANASFYRKFFENKLKEIFEDIREAHEKIDARLKAEQFKQKVMACFRVWEDWAVYPNEFLIHLQNTFLGLTSKDANADLDGAPIEDVDGSPLKERPQEELDGKEIEDFDGQPLNDDIDGAPMSKPGATDVQPSDTSGFKYVPSSWETVDKSVLEAQAMTTSKWDMLDSREDDGEEEEVSNMKNDEDLDGEPLDEDDETTRSRHSSPDRSSCDSPLTESHGRGEMTEEKRAKLREIEVKVMKYQDDLEAGRRTRKSSMSLQQQVQHYRRKMLHKESEKERERERDKQRLEERELVREWERARDKERERENRVVRSTDIQQERSSSSEDTALPEFARRYALSPDNSTPSRSTGRTNSPTPPSAYKERSPSPKRSRRSRSPRRRRRSRSPKKGSRSGSPRKSKRSLSRSHSRSPSRHRHKHKKNRKMV